MANKSESDNLIIQKLNHICDRMDKGFDANDEKHAELFREISAIKEAAAAQANHIHPHCEDCLTNTGAIAALEKSVEERFRVRDWVGKIALGSFIATAIKTWFFK